MEAIDRIDSNDWPALEAWARIRGESIDVAAISFEDEYLGEWPTLRQFARDRVQWEYGMPDFLLPFFDDVAYLERAIGADGCFVSVAHATGVWIFQINDEPSWDDAESRVPVKNQIGDPE